MSTRARNHVKGQLERRRKYLEASEFRFKGKDYKHTDRLHLSVLSAFTQANLTNTNQKLVLVDVELGKRRLNLTQMELQTLLDKCDRALKRMEVERTQLGDDDE